MAQLVEPVKQLEQHLTWSIWPTRNLIEFLIQRYYWIVMVPHGTITIYHENTVTNLEDRHPVAVRLDELPF
jgi:hypothetical protein